MAILREILRITCTKPETVATDPPTNPPPPSGNQTDSISADSISDHLQFFGVTKLQGTIPKSPTASSLKISFNDTLYLMEGATAPIKFLHEDTTKNVAGIYVQVGDFSIGYFFYNFSKHFVLSYPLKTS